MQNLKISKVSSQNALDSKIYIGTFCVRGLSPFPPCLSESFKVNVGFILIGHSLPVSWNIFLISLSLTFLI